jgi:hypothetical protein
MDNIIDMKEIFEVERVKQILTVDGEDWIYVLANKYQKELGVFLFRFKVDAFGEPTIDFLYTWRVQLEIGDASIDMFEGDGKASEKNFNYKEMILSFKTAFNNTFNIFVLDMSKEESENRVVFRHESFQMWESKIFAFMNNATNEYVLLSSKGVHLVAIGSEDTRVVKDWGGIQRVLQPMQGYSFLKLNPTNSLYFSTAD